MPRIKRKDIYPLQDPIFSDDYWVGSMGESTATPGKTKNFAASALLAYISENIGVPEGSQDNIGVYRDISYNGDNTFDAIADAINASPAFTVSVYNDMWFRVVNTKVGATRAGLFRMINTGKGDYGTGGAIDLEATDLQFVCSVALEVGDFSGLVGTELVNYGDLTATTVEAWLNGQAATIIQSQEDGYTIFYGTIDGEEMQYLWIGEGGTYGTGNPTATTNDFQLLAGVGGVIPTTPTPNLQEVTDAGYQTTKPIISQTGNNRSEFNNGLIRSSRISTQKDAGMQNGEEFFFAQNNSTSLLVIKAPTLDAATTLIQTYQKRNGIIAIQNYKSVMLYILQTGTAAPVVTVVGSAATTEIGTITPTRSSAGLYYLDCADFVPVATNRIAIIPQTALNAGPTGIAQLYADIEPSPQNRIRLQTRRITSFSNAGTLADDALASQFMEIRIYN